MDFVFGLQTLNLKDSSKIYQFKGLKPKNKGHTNFYECCDLTKKVYLVLPHRQKEIPESQQNVISSTSEISLYCDFLGLQIGSIWSRILKIGSV